MWIRWTGNRGKRYIYMYIRRQINWKGKKKKVATSEKEKKEGGE